MQKYQWINPTESFPWCSACNEVGLESWILERVIWKVFIGERVHKEEQEIFMENWFFLFVDSIYTLCSQFSKRWIPITTQTNIHHVFYQTNWLDLGMKQALDEQREYTEEMFQRDHERIQLLINDV